MQLDIGSETTVKFVHATANCLLTWISVLRVYLMNILRDDIRTDRQADGQAAMHKTPSCTHTHMMIYFWWQSNSISSQTKEVIHLPMTPYTEIKTTKSVTSQRICTTLLIEIITFYKLENIFSVDWLFNLNPGEKGFKGNLASTRFEVPWGCLLKFTYSCMWDLWKEHPAITCRVIVLSVAVCVLWHEGEVKGYLSQVHRSKNILLDVPMEDLLTL